MSSETEPQTSRGRTGRRLLGGVLIGLLVLAAWLGYFLATIDLNDYRTELEKGLSEQLDLPVHIGRIDYSLHKTALSLQIRDLNAGSEYTQRQLEVPRIWCELLWRNLLRGEVRFSRITLAAPKARVDLSGEPTPQSDHNATPFKASGFGATLINTLVITEGTARINLPANGTTKELVFTKLHGTLKELGLSRNSAMALEGSLKLSDQTVASPFQINTRADLAALAAGKSAAFNLAATASELNIATLSEALTTTPFGISVQGTASLKLNASGAISGPVTAQLDINGQELSIESRDSAWGPVRLKDLSIGGQWRQEDARQYFEKLSVHFDDSLFTGTVLWDRAVNFVDIELGEGFLSTATLSKLSSVFPETTQTVLTRLDPERGRVTIGKGTLSHRPVPSEDGTAWHLEKLSAKLDDLHWSAADRPIASLQQLQVAFDGNQLQLENGQASVGPVDLQFNGRLTNAAESTRVLSVDLQGHLDAAKLPIPDESGFALAGLMPFSGQLHGPPQALKLDLLSDLGEFSLAAGEQLRLTPREGDHLNLNAQLESEQLSLEHVDLQWSVLEGIINGEVPLQHPEDLSLQGLLTLSDLSLLNNVAPALDKVPLSGQADLGFRLRGLPRKQLPEMTLTLRDVGIGTGRVIADLSRINGRIHFTDKGFASERLQVRLGESPLTVHVFLADFRDPTLDLRVTAPTVRADELIFYSETSHLRNIEGHLLIDREGLRFDPVQLTLDKGSDPVVRGAVHFGKPLRVELDITADHADIGEVIGLWVNKSPEFQKKLAEHRAARRDKPRPIVTINARVHEGILYGMRFHEADGTITPTRERLIIHPLDFHVGEGFFNTQVLVDFDPAKPSLLRISGHAEKVDADAVYRELLNQKNIVKGSLRGDFYLQGEVGKSFLPTSYGHFNIELDRGVLYRFQVLSKIFSLLNVSQLFAFKLPDMDKEGMPYDRLTGHLALDRGTLSSEDLLIRSEAMNQAYHGSYNLIDKELDLVVAINPLGTVDKVVTKVPVAGWLLTGEDKALLTAHFTVTGKANDISVTPIPITSLSSKTFGLLKRTLSLPFKLFEDPKILWGGHGYDE